MRKRDRLKNRLKRLMGGPVDIQPPVADAPAPIVPPPAQVAPPKPVAPPKLVAPPKPVPAPEAVAEAPPDSKAEEMAKKAAKHFEKTRVAMLKFVIEQGGEASMADMHALSERRYFIGHRRFSDLMEGIVGEGLIDFDHATGMAQITDAGAAYVAK